jgi:preprotein translocase subunit SecE
MTDEIKVPDSGASDKVKAALAVLLIAGGITGYYLLSAQPAWQRWIAVAAGVVLATGAIAWSAYGRAFWQFVMDSRGELRKVVWPSRQETGTTTLVVLGFVIIAGLFFWTLDLVLAWATKALSGQGG